MPKEHKRNCPTCNTALTYASYMGWYNAKTKNSNCRKCASIKTGFTAKFGTKGQNTGVTNAFYGKHHTDETKKAIVKNKNYTSYKTQEFKDKISAATKGSKNPMYGRKVYDIWVEKYGKEEADKKQQELNSRQSIKNSGSGNPMYGKSSPQGAGNGWKGWYKTYFFRSLRELCYLIELEDKGIKWRTGETIKIQYPHYKGYIANYYPDFILNDKDIVEIKPIRLHNSPLVKLKCTAAEKYCKENSLTYKIIDVVIDIKKIRTNVDNNNIKFNQDYLERFEAYEKGNNT